jgi:hypothetical protein
LGGLFFKNVLEPSLKSFVFKSYFLLPSGFIFKKLVKQIFLTHDYKKDIRMCQGKMASKKSLTKRVRYFNY